MKTFSQVYVARPYMVGFLRSILVCSLAAFCSCSPSASSPEDPLVPLGTMSGTMDMASEHAELLIVLKTNGLLIAGGGSRIWQFDVPLSKFDLAVSILRTNRLVRDNIFELNTNKSYRTFPKRNHDKWSSGHFLKGNPVMMTAQQCQMVC